MPGVYGGVKIESLSLIKLSWPMQVHGTDIVPVLSENFRAIWRYF